MGEGRRLAAGFRGFCRHFTAISAIDRLLSRARSPACGWWKKGGPDHAIGRSRGGLTSKIHVVVDGHGRAVRLAITQGQASDKATAPVLLDGLQAASVVIADRGYDWQHLIDLVRQRGGEAHIPTQRDRKQQRAVHLDIYRKRNIVERFFCKLKHFRRIATRYDKLAASFLSFIHLACAFVWLA
jgi:transposase